MVDEQIIRALRGEALQHHALGRLREHLGSGASPEMLARTALGAAPTRESLMKSMSALERIAEHDADLALMLMLGLYPVASEAFAHDICDSIELWLEHEGTRTVRDFAAMLLSTHELYGAREKLAAWVELLAAR